MPPVSPNVQSYMSSQQQGQQEAGQMPSEQIFRSKFLDAAFATLRAKYPQLVGLVVTLKILEADIETGFCLGTFILKSAKDVQYVPVVMTGGSITSCEMVYDKTDNQFMPLIQKVVQDIVNTNSVETGELISSKPRVDDTRALFKNLLRPPTSTNAILASNTKDVVSNLPNEAKEVVFTYLHNNPEFLAKVAEFYPVEVLAQKLARTVEDHLPDVNYPDVIDIDNVKTAAEKMLTEEKEQLLRDGYVVTKKTKDVEVVPKAGAVEGIVGGLRLTEENLGEYGSNIVKVGRCFKIGAGGPSPEEALVIPKVHGVVTDKIYIADMGAVSCGSWGPKAFASTETVLATSMRSALTSDLQHFGATSPKELKITDSEKQGAVVVFTPQRDGTYATVLVGVYGGIECVNKSDGIITIKQRYSDDSYIFTDAIDFGTVKTDGMCFLPMNSLVLVGKRERSFPFIRKSSSLVKYILSSGVSLSLLGDTAGYTLNNKSSNKSRSFAKKAELIKHLVSDYKFNDENVATALSLKDVFVFNKTAFLQGPAAIDVGTNNEQSVAPFMQRTPAFNPQTMHDFADMQDPDMFDTGILAAFGGDADIKDNFVDLLPVFLSNITAVAKVILLCATQKEEMEKYYGREKYQTFLSTARRVFKSLGEIVVSLKSYVNMHQ